MQLTSAPTVVVVGGGGGNFLLCSFHLLWRPEGPINFRAASSVTVPPPSVRVRLRLSVRFRRFRCRREVSKRFYVFVAREREGKLSFAPLCADDGHGADVRAKFHGKQAKNERARVERMSERAK